MSLAKAWKYAAKLYKSFYRLTYEQAIEFKVKWYHARRWSAAWKREAKKWREIAYEYEWEKSCERIAELEKEISEARMALREICAEFGDNNWPDNLYLYDIITKHIY